MEEELARAVAAAKRVAAATRVFEVGARRALRLPQEGDAGALLLALLELAKRGGAAPLSALGRAAGALGKLEEAGLVRVYRTPFRRYAALTEEGWRVVHSVLSLRA